MATPVTTFNKAEIHDWTFNNVSLEEAYMNGVLVFKRTLVIDIANHFSNATSNGDKYIHIANLIRDRRHSNETNVVINIVSGAEVPSLIVGGVSGVTSLIINNHGTISAYCINGEGLRADTDFTLNNYGTIRGGGKNGAKGAKGATGAKGADDHHDVPHYQHRYESNNCTTTGKSCNYSHNGSRFIWNGHTTNYSGDQRNAWKTISGESSRYTFHFGDFVKDINCGSGGAREYKITERHFTSEIRRGGAGGSGGEGGAGGTGQYYLHAAVNGHTGHTGGAGHGSNPSGGHSGHRGVTGHTGENGGTWGHDGHSIIHANRVNIAVRGTLIGSVVDA